MLVFIVNHQVKPGRMADAEAALAGSSKAVSAAKGCAFRYVVLSEKDPMKLSTLTGWESKEAYDEYRRASTAAPNPDSPFGEVTAEFHEVKGTY